MKHSKTWFVVLFLTFSSTIFAQKSDIYTNSLKEYNHAVELYNNRDFVASKHLFDKLKSQFDNSSEYRANCEITRRFVLYS